jgi:hypothetical protein
MMDFATSFPTASQLADAHQKFGVDPYYPAALLGVDEGLRLNRLGDVAQAIAAFLKGWNRTYYRFHPAKKLSLESELEQLVASHLRTILGFRARSISSLESTDRGTILDLVSAFEGKLGPVGCAKSLNLLAPSFFPLWDNPIADAYGVAVGRNGYLLFMLISKYQVEECNGFFPVGIAALKALDEYNYCEYTMHFQESQRVAKKGGSEQSAADKIAYPRGLKPRLLAGW